jgi:HEAT repeat protein
MITDELLHRTIGLELFALSLAIAAIVGNALRTARGDRRLRTGMNAGRPLLLAAIDGPLDDDQLGRLHRLGRHIQIRLFAEIAPSLEGAQRAALRALSARLGITAGATRRSQSRWWWRRLYATRVLTLVDGGEDVMPALIRDPHPLVRAQVAEWAALHPDPATLLTLVELLDDQTRIARFSVQDTLLRIGRPTVPVLIERLGTMGPLGIASGLLVAARLGDPDLLPLALAFADHPMADVRAAAADVLGAIGGEAAVEVLHRSLGDPATEVREAAAHGLGRLEHWPSASVLLPLLSDPTWPVRQEAALALSAMGAPGSLILRTALRGSDRFAADIAAQALGAERA